MNDTYDTNVWSVLERIRNQGLEDYEYEEFNDTDDEPGSLVFTLISTVKFSVYYS